MKLFEVGKSYEAWFKRRTTDEEYNETGQLCTSEIIVVTIIKRTAKTVTVKRPWTNEGLYRPKVYVMPNDVEVTECGDFRMYASNVV